MNVIKSPNKHIECNLQAFNFWQSLFYCCWLIKTIVIFSFFGQNHTFHSYQFWACNFFIRNDLRSTFFSMENFYKLPLYVNNISSNGWKHSKEIYFIEKTFLWCNLQWLSESHIKSVNKHVGCLISMTL